MVKFKKLKKIKIGSSKFKIEWKKDVRGANFDFKTHIIQVGTQHSKEEQWEYLIHELSEICHVVLGSRFWDSHNDSYVFIQSHKEFENHNAMLSQVILKFLK